MGKGRRGFSLVEVVCAMTIVTIISVVTIGLISSSNRVMSNSKLAVGAANEARNIIDCYTAAVMQARATIDTKSPSETLQGKEFSKFLDYVEKLHEGEEALQRDAVYNVETSTYTFYYNGKYELVSKDKSTVELTLITQDGKLPEVEVKRRDNKKILFSN